VPRPERPHAVRALLLVQRLLPEEAQSLANVDYDRRMAIVAEADEGPESELVGVARYGPPGDGTIDVGLVVADGWQGLGLGPRLLDELLKAGERRGIHQFQADVLTDNSRALRLLARHTAIVHRTIDSGITSLVFSAAVREALDVQIAAIGSGGIGG
jgi:acetyltransferase